MHDKILFLYAQGMTTREIVATFKEMYGADISASLISKVTDAVIEQVIEWPSRPLDAVYPMVYLDRIVVKIRQDKQRSSTKSCTSPWALTWKLIKRY
jgi:putative transposase